MDHRKLYLLLLAAACSTGEAPPAQRGATTGDSALAAPGGTGATRASTTSGEAGGTITAVGSPANLQGRIPVLEYHVIGGEKNTLYTRTVASYRSDLDSAYKLGYRPITMAQMLDKDFRDVPAGMSPVVVVF
ncbi:MAG: hypothetical protein ABIV10_02680, partial [Gemmatimonadaceae bacterium]